MITSTVVCAELELHSLRITLLLYAFSLSDTINFCMCQSLCQKGSLIKCKSHDFKQFCKLGFQFNVEVPAEDLSYHKKENGNTLVDIYCVQCGMLLGHKLSYWDDLPLVYLNDEQVGGANDQVGGANEQGPNDQDGGANEQNADQDGGTNEQNANQDGGVNEDADQLAEGIDNIDLNPDL
ncbi:hypothetical protein RND71_006690 [Anisodus tanguticus]|uniref:Yippee domain-containing protein n=1 Tax=Anisodus tanguticus TaxID=243964 RepID=A0AAE1VMK8_9SOLA|nr:hypothetical protein RND71_006690 [Anisodus tanguticus]